MLLREDCRRREDGDLFAFHDGFEGSANCHFGFAKADIAADQPIHRARLFHVAFCLGNCFELVGRFAKREGVLEFELPFCVGAEGIAALRFALGL